MQVEDLLEMTAHLRVFKLPNFEAGWGVGAWVGGGGELALEFWWHINLHVAYKKLMLQGYFFYGLTIYLVSACLDVNCRRS